VELDEIYQPLIVERRGFLADTEGAGRFTGAPSTIVEFGPIAGSIEIAYGADGHLNPPKGVRGGGEGGRADQHVRRADGSLERLPACAQVQLAEGEMILAISTGGGGYGPAIARDPDAVAHDVGEGWISAERARAVYGVILDATGALDAAATAARREGLAA